MIVNVLTYVCTIRSFRKFHIRKIFIHTVHLTWLFSTLLSLAVGNKMVVRIHKQVITSGSGKPALYLLTSYYQSISNIYVGILNICGLHDLNISLRCCSQKLHDYFCIFTFSCFILLCHLSFNILYPVN